MALAIQPFISIIIPVLNSQNTIGDCLKSITAQDYPKDKLEILIADGGSTDATIDIIKSFSLTNLKILPNPLKTGEAGKAVGAKAARADIAAFIDSDNILPSENWLKRMIEPFCDPDIIASEPLEYTYRETDGLITRYSALLGMNDPLCLFIGNYDRYSHLTGTWTQILHSEEDKGNYLKATFSGKRLPTIGANGFLIRRDFLKSTGIADYLFDIDVLYSRLEDLGQLSIAKVKIGIMHIFSGDIRDFIRKQRRRIRDYAYYNSLGLRKYKWAGKPLFFGTLKFAIFTALLLPLLIQAIIGYIRKRDRAWFFHIPACILTFYIYSLASLQNIFVNKPFNRSNWQLPKRP